MLIDKKNMYNEHVVPAEVPEFYREKRLKINCSESVKISGGRLASMKKRTENRGKKKEDWQWKSEERQTWTLNHHAREEEGGGGSQFPKPTYSSKSVG